MKLRLLEQKRGQETGKQVSVLSPGSKAQLTHAGHPRSLMNTFCHQHRGFSGNCLSGLWNTVFLQSGENQIPHTPACVPSFGRVNLGITLALCKLLAKNKNKKIKDILYFFKVANILGPKGKSGAKHYIIGTLWLKSYWQPPAGKSKRKGAHFCKSIWCNHLSWSSTADNGTAFLRSSSNHLLLTWTW